MTSQSDALTRVVEGRAVPVPRRWAFEAGNSEIAFSVKHMMISRVRGRFKDFSGTIEIADQPEESTAAVSIAAASIDTGLDFRDKDMRGPDFLDVERHPTLEFTSTDLKAAGDTWELTGDLTIAGRTRPITLDVEFQGAAIDPWGHQKAVFSAKTELVREDFGLTYNKAIEGGGVLIGSTIRIEIEIQAKPILDA